MCDMGPFPRYCHVCVYICATWALFPGTVTYVCIYVRHGPFSQVLPHMCVYMCDMGPFPRYCRIYVRHGPFSQVLSHICVTWALFPGTVAYMCDMGPFPRYCHMCVYMYTRVIPILHCHNTSKLLSFYLCLLVLSLLTVSMK